MNSRTLILAAFVSSAMLACNKVSFTPAAVTNQKMEDPGFPLDPVPTTTTTTTTSTTTSTTTTTTTLPAPVLKTGQCANNENVASCLKCEVPPLPPTVSTKAQKLAKIMSMACQIPNRSYPANYVPPTAAQVEAHLLACSPTLYPETPMSSAQSAAIDKLLDEKDPSLRQKMFKGLWYQPPYTEYYETYFGLDNSEAAYVICMNSGSLTSILGTKEYIDASSGGNYDAWLNDRAAQERWNFAQMLRQQLLSCFNKPGTPPPPVQPPDAKVCQYRSFEGLYDQGGAQEISQNLADGYKVAVETSNACVQITSLPAAGSLKGQVKIVGYKCP